MARTSKKNRGRGKKKSNVSVEYESPLNLLPYDIWVRIAMKVASKSIHDLFHMQATCKVFLDATRSDAVYKHATMWYLPLVSFLFYFDGHERRFIDHCLEAGNHDALIQDEMMEYLWIGHRVHGMEQLNRAATDGNSEVGYLCAMLLLCNNEDEEDRRRGVEFFEVVRASRVVERCREVFREKIDERWVKEKLSDPGQPMEC